MVALIRKDPVSPSSSRAARILNELGQVDQLKYLLQDESETVIQAGMIALRHINNPTSLDVLENYVRDQSRPMHLRKMAVQNLAGGWNGEDRMVALLEANTLPPELAKVGATQLLGVWRAHYRTIASEYLNLDQQSSDLPPIHELVLKKGKVAQGESVFQTYCRSCHLVGEEGIDFGPALTEIGRKLSKDALYASIISPSNGISFGYESWLIELKDGSKMIGYIISRTEEEIELRMSGGITQVISPEDIQKMEMQEQSLMTPGLHQAMQEEELVSLVEYLASLGV